MRPPYQQPFRAAPVAGKPVHLNGIGRKRMWLIPSEWEGLRGSYSVCQELPLRRNSCRCHLLFPHFFVPSCSSVCSCSVSAHCSLPSNKVRRSGYCSTPGSKFSPRSFLHLLIAPC